MQAIVKQLSLRSPGLPKPVVEAYEKRKNDGFSAGDLRLQESCDLISSILDMYPQSTIAIDALDETYPNERWKLFNALKTLIESSTSLVKVFVSSRDDDDITRKLNDVPNLYIKASDNMADIERFIHREIKRSIEDGRLLRGEVKEELKQEIISTLLSKSDGM
jgi:hypothetical protein